MKKSIQVTWLCSRADIYEVAWCGLPLHHLLRVVRCVELCPQALNQPDLHFEGAGNGPVFITSIGREHELYSGASPISLVEHCVTFRHDRRLLWLLGFINNWSTGRWSATKKKKKKRKENRFSLNENGIMSSFLGRQFYRSTLYIYIYIYIYICVCVCVCVYQSKVSVHPQKFFISHPKSIIFMKQVKHHNDFMYYTKYKYSWATLNTIKNKTKKKHQNF